MIEPGTPRGWPVGGPATDGKPEIVNVRILAIPQRERGEGLIKLVAGFGVDIPQKSTLVLRADEGKFNSNALATLGPTNDTLRAQPGQVRRLPKYDVELRANGEDLLGAEAETGVAHILGLGNVITLAVGHDNRHLRSNPRNSFHPKHNGHVYSLCVHI